MMVQMLGMFAQFERDTHHRPSDRRDGTQSRRWQMERRQAPVRLPSRRGGQQPCPDPGEAAVVRLIFGTYIRDRLGARAIATLLNDRGHRTTTGGRCSAQQVLRVPANCIYLGELPLRGITCTGCHPPLIEQTSLGSCIDQFGGGGGNRTRVLQYITRASPGAACLLISQPRRSCRPAAERAQPLFDVPPSPAAGLDGGSS
jgi:Recombinase